MCSVGTGCKRIGSQSSIAEYVGPISSLVQQPSTHVRIDPDVVPSIFAFSELKEKENLGHIARFQRLLQRRKLALYAKFN